MNYVVTHSRISQMMTKLDTELTETIQEIVGNAKICSGDGHDVIEFDNGRLVEMAKVGKLAKLDFKHRLEILKDLADMKYRTYKM